MILDTYRFVENLLAAGFNKKQAEIFVQELNTNTSDLATKQDIEMVKKDLDSVRREIKSEITVLKWMVGLVCAMTVMMFSLMITSKF